MQASAGSNLYTRQSGLDFGAVGPVASETSPAGETDESADVEPDGFDWADPDRFADEIETALWYDVDCDPYSRGGLDVDFSDDDLDRSDLPPAPVEFYLGTHRPHRGLAHPVLNRSPADAGRLPSDNPRIEVSWGRPVPVAVVEAPGHG